MPKRKPDNEPRYEKINRAWNVSDNRQSFSTPPVTMKHIKEKFKRIMKYLRISYRQASGPDRLFMGMFGLLMLVYAWWVAMVF